MIGFTNYDEPTVVPQLTLKERIALMTNAEKVNILNGFIAKTLPARLKYTVPVSLDLIKEMYKEFDRIEETSRSLMRGEIIVKPEVIDSKTGEVTTPAVYNKIPNSIAVLKSTLSPEFVDSFNTSEVGYIVDKMIKHSKADGKGTAAYYSVEVKK